MDDLKQKFLGAYGGVLVQSEEEFIRLREWLSVNDLFLSNGEPAGKLSYIDGLNVVYRNDQAKIEYTALSDAPTFLEKICNVEELLGPAGERETSVAPAELEMVVESIVPAVINSNIKKFKEAIIPAVQKYKNIVVTKENYKDVKKTLTDINKSGKQINDYKIDVKKQANAPVIEFEEDVKEILAAYDLVVEPIKNAIKKFEDEAKQEKKKKLLEKINGLKKVAVDNGFISKEYADKIEFNDDWLKTTWTETKVLQEVNTKLNELVAQETKDNDQRQKDKESIALIYSQTAKANDVPENSDLSKYEEMLNQGLNMPQIIKHITEDIKTIVQATQVVKEEVKKEVEETIKESIPVPASSPILGQEEKQMVTDPTSGEVYGFFTPDKIVAKIQPNQAPGKIYKYTYEFEGDAGVIKTLAKIMLILSKINETFKFSGKMVK